MDIKNRNVNVWFVAAVLLVVSGVAFGARIGQYIYTDRLYKGNGELIWNFANGDLPVSGATVIVSKENDGYTYVRWWNGTVLYKSNDGHDDDDIQAAIDAIKLIGGKIVIKDGEYIIGNTIDASGITNPIEIVMSKDVILKASDTFADTVMLYFYNSGNWIIKGGIIDGNGKATKLLEFGAKGNIIIDGVEFRNNIDKPSVLGNSFSTALPPAENIVIKNCYFHDCGELFIAYPYKNVKIINNRLVNISKTVSAAGIVVNYYGNATSRTTDVLINGNYLENALIFTQYCDRVIYSNNIIVNPPGDGADIQHSKDVMRIGNIVIGAADVGMADLSNDRSIIVANTVLNSANYGIKISNSTMTIIKGNIIKGVTNYDGIHITGPAGFPSHAIIIGNEVSNISGDCIADHSPVAITNIIQNNKMENCGGSALAGGNLVNDIIENNIGYHYTSQFDFPTSAPATPQTGDVYFNATTNTLYIYNGTTWVSTVLN